MRKKKPSYRLIPMISKPVMAISLLLFILLPTIVGVVWTKFNGICAAASLVGLTAYILLYVFKRKDI